MSAEDLFSQLFGGGMGGGRVGPRVPRKGKDMAHGLKGLLLLFRLGAPSLSLTQSLSFF